MSTEEKIRQGAEREAVDAGKEEEDYAELTIEQVEARAEQQVAVIEQTATSFANQARQDQASGMDAGAVEALHEMEAVVVEAQQVKKSFLDRLAEIVGKPGQKLKEHQARRRTEALATPDNPKVMKEIKDRLKKIEALRDRLRDREYAKRDDRDSLRIDQDILCKEDVGKEIDEAAELYQKAKKEKKGNWAGVERELVPVIVQSMEAHAANGDFDKALSRWDALPERKQEDDQINESLLRVIFRKEMDHVKATYPSQDRLFEAATFIKKLEAYDAFDSGFSHKVKDRSPLGQAYEWRKKDWLRGLMFSGSAERFFVEQPRDILQGLANLSEAHQKFVSDAWARAIDRDFGSSSIDWPEVIRDSRCSEIIDLFIAFPDVRWYTQENDHEAVIKILDQFTSQEREASLKKVESVIKKNGTPDWGLLYSYIFLGSLPNSTIAQIEKLSREHVQALAAVTIAYGEETLRELWNDENVEDFCETAHFREPRQFIAFAKSLSPALRGHLPKRTSTGSGFESRTRPGHTVWSSHGLQGLEHTLVQFKEWWEFVPPATRDEIAGFLDPTESLSYIRYDERLQSLSEEQTRNFLEYQHLFTNSRRVSIEGLVHAGPYFTAERWANIKKGIEEFKKMGFSEETQKPTNNLIEWLDVFETAGKVEHQDAHKLISLFLNTAPTYVRKDPYGYEGYKQRERAPGNIQSLYRFLETCHTYFARDADLVVTLLRLSPEDQRIIQSVLDGSLLVKGDQYADLQLVEGRLLGLADFFHGRGSENIDAQLTGFVTLDRVQKQNYLHLRAGLLVGDTPANYALLFELATGEQGGQLAEFLAQSRMTGLPLPLAEKMMNRPDGMGLFYYIYPHGNKPEDIERMMEKLIELKEAGCPEKYFLTAETAHEGVQIANTPGKFYGDYDRYQDWFLQWDMEKLAALAKVAEQEHFPGTLRDLLRLPPGGTLEELSQSVQMAALQKEDYLFAPDISRFEKGSVAQLRQRIQEAEKLLGKELSKENRQSVRIFSETIWNRISKDGEVLQHVLDVMQQFSFPIEEAMQLDDAVLKNPLFWKLRLPKEIMVNAQTVHEAIAIAEELQEIGIELDTGNETYWRKWLETRTHAPWLFTRENLELFRTLGIHEIHKFSEISETDFNILRPFLSEYQIRNEELSEFLTYVRSGQTILPKETLSKLKAQLGMRLPWSLLKEIKANLQKGSTLDEIISEFEAQWKPETSPFGRLKVSQWQQLRENNIARQTEDAQIFMDHFGGSAEQWSQLEQLSPSVLRNFAAIARVTHQPHKSEQFDNLIYIAGHHNFEIIARFFVKRKNDSFASIARNKLEYICEHITDEAIEKYSKIPEYLTIYPEDFVAFFQDSAADHVIEFAKKLREIFGEKLKTSVYDLLVMDASTDLENLKILQAQSLHPLNEELLQGLNLVTKDSAHETIQRTLSIFNDRAKMDVSLATVALRRLSPRLRLAVIHEKGLKSFGWEILQHESELQEMGMNADAVDDFIRQLYRRDNHVPFIDYRIARALITDTVPDEGKRERMLHSIRAYQGEMSELLELFLAQETILAQAATQEWKTIPELFKQEPRFWEGLLRNEAVTFWDHFEEMATDISMPEDSLSKSVEAYIQKGGTLEFLSAPLTDTIPERLRFKRSFFESRIEEFMTSRWKEDPHTSAEIISRVALSGILGIHHMPRLHDILIELHKEAQPDSKLITQVEHAFIETIVRIDPTVRRTFTDPKRLGRLKDVVVRNLVEYLQTLFNAESEGAIDIAVIERDVRHKLLEIRRVFESSDASESERRMIFLDMYNLTECRDPSVAEDTKDAAVIRRRIEQDVRDVLVRSGSYQEMRFLRRMGNDELVKRYENVLQGADRRNRQLSEFLPDGALTHGTSSQNLSLILDGGNFSGELLGPEGRRDASGLLGVDLGKVVDPVDPESGVKVTRSFPERLSQLMNLSYGDIHLIYGEYQKNPLNDERPAFASSPEHQLVRTGIPSSEITAIVIKQNHVLAQVSKDIATKGFYIPLLDTSGNIVFSQEEFDEMKVFYHGLSKKGYPMKLIDDVYAFYKNPQGSDKHKVVIQKAFEDAKTPQAGGREAEDLAILVSFLRSNDLNARSIEWYQGATFGEIKRLIKGAVGRKSRAKARAMLFENPPQESLSMQEAVKAVKQLRRKANVFLDNFFNTQLPFSGQEGQAGTYEEAAVDLLFDRKGSQRIPEVSKLFTEQKKELMRQLWTKVWDETLGDANLSAEDRQALLRKKESLIPVMTGSAGRGEIVLGSDLDYLILVDDETTPLEDEEGLSRLINEVLAPKMNAILKQNGLMGDAGLARKGRTPFSKMSRIKQFAIDLNVNRQEEEPTNIVDADALFDTPRDREVVARSKKYLIEENPSAHLLDSFVLRDLELPSGKYPSYIEQFENLYNNFASGEVLQKIKESLQRVVTFKTYHVMFGAFEDGRIPKTEAPEIPSSTIGKIDFLADRRILTEREAGICKELLAITYKLRFLGELYSKEAEGGEARKVSNVQFRVEDLSYDERARLFGLLKDFKTEVLYK